MKKHMAVKTMMFLALLCLLASLGWAQVLAGGLLEGTISDSTGAVVPATTVTARNLATNLTYSTTSDNSGFFVFPIVKVGTYELKAEKTGFGSVKMDNVVVAVGSKLNVPVTLRVAGSKEEVNVVSEALMVETDRTSVTSNVNERSIEGLPVLGRNFISFVLLTPAVVTDPNRGGDLSFAGMRGTVNSLTVDGNDDNNSFYGQTAGRTGFKTPYQFSQDAVQEFQVASNGYSAEIGRAGGAVINAVTKSGTNRFHGDIFEYYRDQSLNAYDPIQKQNFLVQPKNAGKPFTDLKSKYHFNQYGGSVGGPVWKDKAFFFFNLDDQRNTQPNLVNALPAIGSTAIPFLGPVDPNTNKPTAPSAEQTAAYNYLSARDGSWTKLNNQNTYLIKFDVNVNSKNQVSARWNRVRFTAGNQESSGSTTSLESTGNSYLHTDNANVSLTSTLSPKIVNQLRIAYLRDREPGSANSTKPQATVSNAGSTLLAVGENYFSPRETTIRQYQYSDSVSWMLGRHTVKIGGDAVVAKIKNFFPGNFSGAYTFNGTNGLQDFGCSLMGETPGTIPVNGNGTACVAPTYVQAFAGAGTTGATTHPDTVEPSVFAQDDFRVLKNLVLNLGVRYDYQGTKQSGVQYAPALAFGYDTAKQVINKNEVAPRIGFAYDVLNNGKLVVRGGYGIFYGTTNSMLLGTAMSNNAINVSNYTYTGANAPLYPNVLASAGGKGTTPTPSIWVVDPKFQNPMVQQMNFGVEYAVRSDLSISLSALRVKGDHQTRTADMNMATPVLTSYVDEKQVSHPYYISPSRLTSNFYRVSVFQSNAESQYNALVFEAKKRFSHHVQGTMGYTWSHAIDNAEDATSVTIGAGDDAKEPMYPTMPWLDRGNAGADVRQRLTLGYVWTADYGKHTGWKSAVLDGWSTSGILTAQSGLAYSAMVSNLYLLNNGTNNGKALSGLTANVRDSLVPRNSLRMPATWELDPRIARDVRLPYEGMKLSLFAEAFNVFNHLNITGVRNTDYSLATSGKLAGTLVPQNVANAATTYFGLPTGTAGQRILQLGAKFVF